MLLMLGGGFKLVLVCEIALRVGVEDGSEVRDVPVLLVVVIESKLSMLCVIIECDGGLSVDEIG